MLASSTLLKGMSNNSSRMLKIRTYFPKILTFYLQFLVVKCGIFYVHILIYECLVLSVCYVCGTYMHSHTHAHTHLFNIHAYSFSMNLKGKQKSTRYSFDLGNVWNLPLVNFISTLSQYTMFLLLQMYSRSFLTFLNLNFFF